ncbi:MAG: chromosomal replication initiator protein DnaA [Erysipelotrichia bacterium]|jgi:chromosomal replication initiator protein|nr:chromosomal replication initiator protein DnaA [Erysipelotrichia bacterium]
MSLSQVYLDDLWSKCLNHIKTNNLIESIVFNQYFEDTFLTSLNDTKANVVVKTKLHKVILTQNETLISEVLSKFLNKNIGCSIFLENEVDSNSTTPIISDQYSTNLIPHYTFDSFIEGSSNKESRSAAIACAYMPGKFYNPLFIYGNSGLGKTHLLNAIGNYVLTHYPDKKVHYTTSTDFVSKVVSSIKNNTIEDFKRDLLNVDVLLMDDVQFLAGKEKSHEIFFHIFNDLVNHKKQIVITSDRHPHEIKGLEDRLISRFSSGLSVGVDSPEFETAVAILKSKMEHQSLEPDLVDDEVINYIARDFSSDIRKLEGALNRIIFYSINFGQNRQIDLKTAVSAFKGQSYNDKNELNANKIKRIVSDYYGLTRQQLVSKSRTKNISNARHIAMYLCRKHLDLPFTKIGDEFGNRDHSTVMSSCEKIDKLLKVDFTLSSAITDIEKQFK